MNCNITSDKVLIETHQVVILFKIWPLLHNNYQRLDSVLHPCCAERAHTEQVCTVEHEIIVTEFGLVKIQSTGRMNRIHQQRGYGRDPPGLEKPLFASQNGNETCKWGCYWLSGQKTIYIHRKNWYENLIECTHVNAVTALRNPWQVIQAEKNYQH